ncbi:MAG: hypothetical protein AAF962_19445 [Actinomycetota bacterium]
MIGRSHQLTLVALAALGSLVVHQLAYLAAYPVQATRAAQLADHGHLTTQFALVTPIAVVAAAAFILRQAKGLGLGAGLTARQLTVCTWLLFGIQETVETVLRGDPAWSVITQPAVVLGLLIAPLAAVGFRRMLQVVEDAVRQWYQRPTTAPLPRPRALRPVSDRPLAARFIPTGPTRGPPAITC